jgi:FAD/FMN-containing dehydrogenase
MCALSRRPARRRARDLSSNVVKNTTGYDLKDLVIGSEGTLCFLTQVTLRLIPAPRFTWSLVVPFGTLEACIDTVPKLLAMSFTPTAVEFIEAELLDIVERRMNKPFPRPQRQRLSHPHAGRGQRRRDSSGSPTAPRRLAWKPAPSMC